MTSENPEFPFLRVRDSIQERILPPESIVIMLLTYKFGIVGVKGNVGTLELLRQVGLVQTNLSRTQNWCALTDAGVAWVDKYLFSIMTSCPLSITYPALVPGDELQLLKDLHRPAALGHPSFSGSTHTMDRGRYFLQQITKGRVIVSDDCGMMYTLLLSNTSKILVFRGDQLKSFNEEAKKRFHKIKIKSIVKRLASSKNALILTEWIEDLYNKSHTKWRMGD